MPERSQINSALVLVFTLCAFVPLQAVSEKASAECYSPAVIDMGDGTANLGFIADRERTSNISFNPALLAGGDPLSVNFGYANYLVTSRTVMISFKGRVRKLGFGIHTSYLSGGVINRTTGDDPAGQASGSFTYSESSVGVGIGTQLVSWLDLGGFVRFARIDAEDYAKTRGFFDSGAIVNLQKLLFGVGKGWELNLGLVTRGVEISRGSKCEEEKIGQEISVNASIPKKGLRFALGWLSSTSGSREVRGGLVLKPAEDFELILGSRRRLGEFGDSRQGFPWHRGLIAGFGLRFGTHWLNYTYEDASPLQGIHRFVLRSVFRY